MHPIKIMVLFAFQMQSERIRTASAVMQLLRKSSSRGGRSLSQRGCQPHSCFRIWAPQTHFKRGSCWHLQAQAQNIHPASGRRYACEYVRAAEHRPSQQVSEPGPQSFSCLCGPGQSLVLAGWLTTAPHTTDAHCLQAHSQYESAV